MAAVGAGDGAGGATFRGTVLAPASPKITVRSETLGHEATYDGDHQTRASERTVIDIPATDFVFAGMTLQRGDAPKVTDQGAGVEAQAALGGQSVRFGGGKIVLGQFAGDPSAGSGQALEVAGPLAEALAE